MSDNLNSKLTNAHSGLLMIDNGNYKVTLQTPYLGHWYQMV